MSLSTPNVYNNSIIQDFKWISHVSNKIVCLMFYFIVSSSGIFY